MITASHNAYTDNGVKLFAAGGLKLTLSDGTTITFANVTNPSVLNGKIQYG